MNTRAKRPGETDGHHAVVLGGSLAGLLAARVLADHFERVTLIERDAYLETSEARRGTPQANHVHGLLVRGRQILEEFFPGLPANSISSIGMFLSLPGSDESVRRGHRLCIEPKHETEVSVDEDTDRNNS